MSDDEIKWDKDTDEAYWSALLADEEALVGRQERWGGEDVGAGLGSEGPYEVISAGEGEEDNKRYSLGCRDGDWQRAETALRARDCFEVPVIGCNRGGVLVSFGSLTGFVPCSHLADVPRVVDASRRMHALRAREGELLRVRPIEVDRVQGRLILSETAAVETVEVGDPLDKLKPGQVCSGRVVQVRPFGAFVDLGGMEGLVHISELSWGWVAHPADLLQPGDEVEVCVIGINRDERKVALSTKRLQPDPWTLVDERYAIGQLVEGVITNVVNFGAFMQLEEGLEGLIHISELANGSFMHPRMVVQEGSAVTARILDIDSANHRLALSLRQVTNHADPVAAGVAKAPCTEGEPESGTLDSMDGRP